jgi:MFS family permease
VISNRTAVRFPDFRRYLLARLLWLASSQMLVVAVGFQIYEISRNPFDLALVGLSQFLPFILLVLPAGHMADTFDRRRLLIGCFVLLAVLGALLAVVTLSDPTSTAPIILLMSLFGAARAIALPTSQALLPNLVPTEWFASAAGISSTALQIALIVGPALAGVLLVVGPAVVYGAIVVALGIATVSVMAIHAGGRQPGQVSRTGTSFAALMSGILFVRSRPLILGAISLDMFAVLFGGATALLPIYASDVLQVGPTGLGVLRAAPAVGGLVTALILGIHPLQRPVGPWLFGSIIVFGAATILFAQSELLLLSLVALVIMGVADTISVFIRNLLVQLSTPDEIRGRVSAVNGVFVGASSEVGDFESGLTASWWGAVAAATVGGFATVAVGLVWAVLFPALRKLDRFPSQAPTMEPPADASRIGDQERSAST